MKLVCKSCGRAELHCAHNHCACKNPPHWWHELHSIAVCDEVAEKIFAENFWADRIFFDALSTDDTARKERIRQWNVTDV